jgi:hypothetical protein
VPARTILNTLALSAWVLASAVAFLIVAYTTFFGIAVIGLAICYVSSRFELDANRPIGSSFVTGIHEQQLRADRDLTVEQRMSVHHEQSLSIQSARFFKHLGLGLMLIGLSGGIYYQL